MPRIRYSPFLSKFPLPRGSFWERSSNSSGSILSAIVLLPAFPGPSSTSSTRWLVFRFRSSSDHLPLFSVLKPEFLENVARPGDKSVYPEPVGDVRDVPREAKEELDPEVRFVVSSPNNLITFSLFHVCLITFEGDSRAFFRLLNGRAHFPPNNPRSLFIWSRPPSLLPLFFLSKSSRKI